MALGNGPSAAPWVLNLIELIHWTSFPLGFFAAGFIAVRAPQLAPLLGNDPVRPFLLVLVCWREDPAT